ncbi:MAG: hypothetical protein OXK80_06265 [Bdellovibrionales bacterium]|nr:hypothetical protein [Bdellovibrionales bacterium]
MKFIYILLALFVFSLQAEETMQKRLYKKRHNKVQINAGNLAFNNNMDISGDVLVSYSRNFGYFEIGALLGFSNIEMNLTEIDNIMEDLGLTVGLIFEGNFIKNKRRNNWIPSGGLKLVYMAREYDFNRGDDRKEGFYVHPFLSSKHFISSRTSINLELEYPLKVWEWETDEIWRGLNFTFAYAYYFH